LTRWKYNIDNNHHQQRHNNKSRALPHNTDHATESSEQERCNTNFHSPRTKSRGVLRKRVDAREIELREAAPKVERGMG
jgi:hypothetical protein